MNIYLASPGSRDYVVRDNPELMKIFLAGTYSRDPVFFDNPQMRVFLALANSAGTYVYSDEINQMKAVKAAADSDKEMEIFLSGAASAGNIRDMYKQSVTPPERRIYVLESFFYIKDWMIPFIHSHWHFLLDSGAFTFMENAKITPNWDEYIEKYAKFINDEDIELFFELDIDSVVGLAEVERLRSKLEKLTNKRCIPVWHKSRGKDYWIQMCKEYDYIAIGGIAGGEIKKEDYKFFPLLLNIAKDHGTKVHGLGFTNLGGLTKYKFHSVDSTAWIYGNRGGFVQWFDGKTLRKIAAKPGQRMKSKETAIYNFNEWVKFQRYAEENL